MRSVSESLSIKIADDQFIHIERKYSKWLKHRMPHEAWEDLTQEVRVLALLAALKFDPDRGASFGTFLSIYLSSKTKTILRAYIKRRKAVQLMPEFPEHLHPTTRDPDLGFEPKGQASKIYETLLLNNSQALRNKLASNRAFAEVTRLTSLPRAEVIEALGSLKMQVAQCL